MALETDMRERRSHLPRLLPSKLHISSELFILFFYAFSLILATKYLAYHVSLFEGKGLGMCEDES